MFGAIIAFTIIIAILLIIVVLAQNPKGGGLSAQFGGSGASQLMGVKKTTDFLEKATWTLAIILMALAMSSRFAFDQNAGVSTSPAIERAQEQNQLPSIESLRLPDNLDSEDSGLPSLSDSIN